MTKTEQVKAILEDMYPRNIGTYFAEVDGKRKPYTLLSFTGERLRAKTLLIDFEDVEFLDGNMLIIWR